MQFKSNRYYNSSSKKVCVSKTVPASGTSKTESLSKVWGQLTGPSKNLNLF